VCVLMRALRGVFEPKAAEHGLSFSIAPDPQTPYRMILDGGAAGLCVLVYAGQSRIDETPYGRVPVGSRFDLFIAAPAQLSADRAGGGALFRPAGSRKPLVEIVEDFEVMVSGLEIPENDGLAEERAYYEGTDPAVMPGTTRTLMRRQSGRCSALSSISMVRAASA
jgi:hypothetical protein